MSDPSRDADGETSESAVRAPKRGRRWILGSGGVLLVVAIALAVTGLTGLDGPGPLQRHRYADLSDVADLVNSRAGPIRTPDDCWRLIDGTEGPLRDIAKVDYLGARVVVRLYASQLGEVSSTVQRRAERLIDAMVEEDPDFDRDMIVFEASPDGWSPDLTCRVSPGSRVAGS